jgi:hypothetical protein
VPLVASAPLQPPDAVHELALVELQLSVVAPPLATEGGEAARAAVGTTLMPALTTGLVPPGPLQVRTNVEFLVSGPVLWEPLGASVPVQAFDAVHEVALVELHVNVAAPPLGTPPVLVFKAAVGAPAPDTDTVAVATLLVPAGPLQASEYAVVSVSAPVLCVPLVASAPFHPPEAVQEVALLEFHDSVELPPLLTAAGVAVIAAIGTTLIPDFTTGLVPPGPLQVSTNVELWVNGPVLRVPLVASVPLHAFDAMHDVALVELHVRVAAPPLATAPVLEIKLAVGTAAPDTDTVAIATLLLPAGPRQIRV